MLTSLFLLSVKINSIEHLFLGCTRSLSVYALLVDIRVVEKGVAIKTEKGLVQIVYCYRIILPQLICHYRLKGSKFLSP